MNSAPRIRRTAFGDLQIQGFARISHHAAGRAGQKRPKRRNRRKP